MGRVSEKSVEESLQRSSSVPSLSSVPTPRESSSSWSLVLVLLALTLAVATVGVYGVAARWNEKAETTWKLSEESRRSKELLMVEVISQSLIRSITEEKRVVHAIAEHASLQQFYKEDFNSEVWSQVRSWLRK